MRRETNTCWRESQWERLVQAAGKVHGRPSMDFVHLAVEHGAYLTLAVVAFVSAVFPVVNAELAVVGLAAALPHPNLLLLVMVATGGQMAGKCTMYWLGRTGTGLIGARYTEAIERWGHRFRGSGRSVGALVFLSSASGLPPFYLISALAGTFRTNFIAFILAGTAGRFLRFAVLALMPHVANALSH
jgi:membrane protein YqaA with SNARE-associated domain